MIKDDFARQRIKLGDAFHFVAPELDAIRRLRVGRVRSAGCRRARGRRRAAVPDRCDHTGYRPGGAAAYCGGSCLPRSMRHRDFAPGLRIADAVNTGDRSDDDHVIAAEQIGRSQQAQAVDLVVDLRLFFDKEIVARHVRFRLVIIVVADEIGDGIVGEEFAELAVKLGGQGLVVRQDQRRPLRLLDHVGDGVGLAGAGGAEQGLVGDRRDSDRPPGRRSPAAGRPSVENQNEVRTQACFPSRSGTLAYGIAEAGKQNESSIF